jgi:hypothetical protein
MLVLTMLYLRIVMTRSKWNADTSASTGNNKKHTSDRRNSRWTTKNCQPCRHRRRILLINIHDITSTYRTPFIDGRCIVQVLVLVEKMQQQLVPYKYR